MLTAGDERGRTQRGNNNAYCQDNEISWVDWRPDDAWLDVYEITKAALRLRREHPALRQRHHFGGTPDHRRRAQGPGLDAPDGARDEPSRTGTTPTCTRSACSSPATRCAPPGRAASSSATARSCSGSTAGAEAVALTLPANQWVNHGEVVLSTDPDIAEGAPVAAGDRLTLAGRSVLVLRQTDHAR